MRERNLTFGHQMKHRFFLNWKALNWENLRIWHTYYKPKPAHDDVPNWQAYLEWYRQLVVEVLEIAQETGCRPTDSTSRSSNPRYHRARRIPQRLCELPHKHA